MAQRSRQAPQAPVVPVPGQGAQGMQGAAILGQRRQQQPIQVQQVPVANGTAQGIASVADTLTSGITRWQDKQEARAREDRGYAQQEKMAGISMEHDKAMAEKSFGQTKELNRIAQANLIQRETLAATYEFGHTAFSKTIEDATTKVANKRNALMDESNRFLASAQDVNLSPEQRQAAVLASADLRKTAEGLNYDSEPVVRATEQWRVETRRAIEAGQPPPPFPLTETLQKVPPEVMDDLRSGAGIPSDINNVPEYLRPMVGNPATFGRFVAPFAAEVYQVASIQNAEERALHFANLERKVMKRVDAAAQFQDMEKKIQQTASRAAPGYFRQATERMATAPSAQQVQNIQGVNPQIPQDMQANVNRTGVTMTPSTTPRTAPPKPMDAPDPATFGREIMRETVVGLQNEIGPQATQRMNEYLVGQRELGAKQELPFVFHLRGRFASMSKELDAQLEANVTAGTKATAEGGAEYTAVSGPKAALVDIAMKRYGFTKSQAAGFVQQALTEAKNTNDLFLQRVSEAETYQKFTEITGGSRLQMQALQRAYMRDEKTGKVSYDPTGVGVLEKSLGSESLLDAFLDVVEEIHGPGYIQKNIEEAEGSKAYVRSLALDSKEVDPSYYQAELADQKAAIEKRTGGYKNYFEEEEVE